MLKNLKIISLLLLLGSCLCQAQNPDIKRTYNWYFGIKAGLNFSSGAPVSLTNGQLQSDGSCATISDTAGNLLFYTDGLTVWNRNHVQMPNGTGLNGSQVVGRTIIVPKPINNAIYYIFTTKGNPAPYTGFQYSIVNIALNGGLGDVTIKNDTILKDSWERLAAVKHTNGIDVWIAVTQIYTNNIYCYLLTATGLNANPVINSIGNIDNYGGCFFKFSASGRKLALALNLEGSEIFDFDAATGILSNPVIFPAGNWQDCDAEFSPDETKLYFTRWFYAPPTKLCQVNLMAGSATNIVNSLTVIDTADRLVRIQRAADKKLYIANDTKLALAIIKNPNASGTSCNFDTNGVFLNGKQSTEGLPSFVSSYFYDLTDFTGINQFKIQNAVFKIYPNPCSSSLYISCADATCGLTEEINNIQITNMLGQEQPIPTPSQREGNVVVDISNLSNGIYIIQINTQSYQSKQKLIINK